MIGNGEPIASEPGEILLAAGEEGWYDYEAKYTPGGMQLVVPARVPPVRERVRELAVEAFSASGCAGLARVDFFVDGDAVLVNELNTMPGFTQTSVFGSLFAASGIPYPELLDRLVALALERHARRARPDRSRRGVKLPGGIIYEQRCHQAIEFGGRRRRRLHGLRHRRIGRPWPAFR